MPPLLDGYKPEMIAVRAGAQTGTHDQARRNRIPLGRQRVHVGSASERIAIAAHVRPVVFAGQPENVRPLGRHRGVNWDTSQARETQELQQLGHDLQPCQNNT